ncbi:hypothetical protein L596_012435 [Steinernema carpocapsae]|uniref:Receptor expression-enhancing protein n=1 Tax=Steinernema carpocapsae TaxID=34508 RepID=A0A4U5NX10_STECR|nr:hypothetical protein L596_012435 [Steinernema carpocapsae]
MLFNLLARAATTVVGTLFPAYQTYRCVEKAPKEDLRHWLRYWCVYGLSSCVQKAVETFMLHYLIPGYEFAVLGFTMWTALPGAGGSDKVYSTYIRPFLKKHEKKIDQALTEASTSLYDKIRGSAKDAYETAVRAALSAVFTNPKSGTVQTVSVMVEGPPVRREVQAAYVEEEQSDDDLVFIKEEPMDDGYE